MTKKNPKGWFIILLLLASLSAGFSGKKPSSPSLGTSAVVELQDLKAYQAIYAVSDVHGMSAEIKKALAAAKVVDASGNWIAANSMLVVVGDDIDKGPDSVGVVDFWRSLQSQAASAGGLLIHTLGNHEAELLADPVNNLSSVLSQELQSKGLTARDLTDPSTPRGAYLHAEPLAAKIGNWLFCHAGYYPSMSWADFKVKSAQVLGAGDYGDSFILGKSSILEAKNWWKSQAKRDALLALLNENGFVGLVQGHQPNGYNISDQIGAIEGGHFVKIDCGVSPPAGSNPIQILKFPHPEQLTTSQLPDMLVISDDGTSAPIQVNELVGNVKVKPGDDD